MSKMNNENSFQFSAIGKVNSCYKEKFGIPRQSLLVNSPGQIEIFADYSNNDAFRELEKFSHIWVIFVFSETQNQGWNPTVRPPRLGGNKRIGVFASRSMFRPNPVGLSVVELKSIERSGDNIILNINGGDFLDSTPVLDIKPYVPYADSIPSANAAYANSKPLDKLLVNFSAGAMNDIHLNELQYPGLAQLIVEILQMDPRPAYQDKRKEIKSEYAMKLYDFDIKWKIEKDQILVEKLYKRVNP